MVILDTKERDTNGGSYLNGVGMTCWTWGNIIRIVYLCASRSAALGKAILDHLQCVSRRQREIQSGVEGRISLGRSYSRIQLP